MSVLLIDIGNTQTKYCFADSNGLLGEVCVVEDVDALKAEASGVNAIYISSVKQSAVSRTYIDGLSELATVTEAKTEKYAIIGGKTLVNSYPDISTMGVDRWLAMCAGVMCATEEGVDNVLVVDAGTAITCDAVVQGEHKGGFIAPGLHHLQHVLLANTDKVFAANDWPELINLGQDTMACVANGCLAQLQGCVEVARAQINQYCEEYLLIISGGDGNYLLNTQHRPKKHLQNVVLYGLWARFVHNP